MKIQAYHPLRFDLPVFATLAGLSFFCLAFSTAQAASSLINPLTGFTGNSQTNTPDQPTTLAGSGLNVSFIWSGGAGAWERIDFSPSGATFGGNHGGDDGRNYLRTNEVDYATISFSAFVTVNRTAREAVFFGMGTGALGGYKQPDEGTGNASVYLELQNGWDNASRRVLGGTSGASTNVEDGWNPMATVLGLMRLRMDYDAAAQTVAYSIDYNPSGVFVADQAFTAVNVASIAPEWAAGEKSSIYFGGEDSMTFTDFQVTVIPEPSTALLLLGVGVLGFRRRRM